MKAKSDSGQTRYVLVGIMVSTLIVLAMICNVYFSWK